MSETTPSSDQMATVMESADDQSWTIAQNYCALLGDAHGLFAAAVRHLRTGSTKGGNGETVITSLPILRLFKGNTVKSILFHVAQSLYKEKLEGKEDVNGAYLLSLFTAEELASILTITYFFRRIGKIADQKLWVDTSYDIQIQMETGSHVGLAIPAIGRPIGLLTGAIRPLSMALFSAKDALGYKKYRNSLTVKNILFDLSREESDWGCNHLQIASKLLTSLGLGISAVTGITVGLSQGKSTVVELDQEALRYQAAGRWIKALLETENPPPEFSSGTFSASPDKLSLLQKKVEEINENGPSFNWIEKKKEDLSPELADKLNRVSKRQIQQAGAEAKSEEATAPANSEAEEAFE